MGAPKFALISAVESFQGQPAKAEIDTASSWQATSGIGKTAQTVGGTGPEHFVSGSARHGQRVGARQWPPREKPAKKAPVGTTKATNSTDESGAGDAIASFQKT
jgi:hypothetical protein